ncbi:MBOAT family O-acyltransferase [Emcibacter sp. SYSU 3D8]|uniref:MBOAT family O-acyltransferase n=1 Tax=Emcibacter sp. SYSU 3D8 TaxID=3133969 RepID=UPI0031FE6192
MSPHSHRGADQVLFNSNVFLFVYLPVVLVIFHLLRPRTDGRWAMGWLAAASLFFYGYWDIRFLPLLAGSITVNYLLARAIGPDRRKSVFIASLVFNLGLLAFFKYANFFVDNVEALTGFEIAMRQIVLPIGISFFTFTQIAFLVDRRQGKAAQPGIVNYTLFVTFFPHLIAGPILHHREMMSQFESPEGRKWNGGAFNAGLFLLAVGLVKKVVIADSVGAFAAARFARVAAGEQLEAMVAWLTALAYHLQIYFDFSAYCEMAMGLALLFGIRFPANFDSPYQARSIVDFWRRWHMTLSRFLRDYLYVPLGGNRHGEGQRLANLMIVMLLGGLWHGAAWTFVLWGGLHGLYLIVNHAWTRSGLKLPWSWLALVLTNLAVIVAWVPFRADSLATAASLYHSMLFLGDTGLPLEMAQVLARFGVTVDNVHFFAENSRMEFYTGIVWILGAGTIALFAPSALRLLAFQPIATDQETLEAGWAERARSRPKPFPRRRGLTFTTTLACITGLLLFVGVRLINGAPASEFLYFQF